MRKREESKIDQAKHKANVGHSEKKNSVIGELQKNPLMASIVGATLMGQDSVLVSFWGKKGEKIWLGRDLNP